jgi:hypothetical protein
MGGNISFPAITIGTVELPKELILTEMRYIPIFNINLIALMNLRPHKSIFD